MRCPTCSEEVVAGDRFCEACGADLPAEDAGSSAPVTVEMDVESELRSHQMAFPEGEASATPVGFGLVGPAAPASAEPAATAVPGAPAAGQGVAEPQGPVGPPCPTCGEGHLVDGWCDTCGAKAPDPRDHVEVDLGHLAGVSDIGQRYRRNEDAMALQAVAGGPTVAVVCDGVGSTVDPHLASQGAADAAAAVLVTTPADLAGAHAAARAATANVPSAQHVDRDPPSATFLAAALEDGVLRLGTLGDCRAYTVPPHAEPAILTVDDSMEHELVRAGLDPETARNHPQANVITRWLGRDADETWTPRVSEHPLDGPTRIVLCSDGLWRYITSAAHMAELAADGPALETAQRLVAFANAQGGADNITAVVIDAGSPPASPPASPQPAPAVEEGI